MLLLMMMLPKGLYYCTLPPSPVIGGRHTPLRSTINYVPLQQKESLGPGGLSIPGVKHTQSQFLANALSTRRKPWLTLARSSDPGHGEAPHAPPGKQSWPLF